MILLTVLVLLQYGSRLLFINSVYLWLKLKLGIFYKVFRIRKFLVLRNSGANTKSSHVLDNQCHSVAKDTRKITRFVFTYTSTWYKTSEEAKCPLITTNFLYFKRVLLFIFAMTFIQQEDYLKKKMIWHVTLFCTLS